MNDIYKIVFFKFIKIWFFYSIFALINNIQIIINNNIINEPIYQKNLDFSNLTSKYKVIAIYYPYNNSTINNKETVRHINKTYLIHEQIKLAKNHGLFGFGIMYNLSNTYKINENSLKVISDVNELNFPFFIIINNNENINNNQALLKENLKKDKVNLYILLDNILKFFISENYIKFRGEPILGIFNSSLICRYLIKKIRKHLLLNNSLTIFIISINDEKQGLIHNNFTIINYPSLNISLADNLNKIYFYNHYYYILFKKEINTSKPIQNFQIVNGCHPKKFYILLKEYLKEFFKEDETYIIFNAWNDYKGNKYLENNDVYGYAYLNYFSKAIFNLEDNIIYDLSSLENKCKIAVQVHLFYEDLIEDIINKTNNIPVLFDLYITFTNSSLFRNIDNYIKHFSKSNNYELLLVDNKGRDILPFIRQMKYNYKQYKYICHIHSKKSITSPHIGLLWRNYLFNNLLGNINIISQNINDFEQNAKLGFIFPETFYGIIKHFFKLTKQTEYWMNFLSSKLFDQINIGKLLEFPAGNMFWAKTKAIYQIFIYDLSKYFPIEDEQTNDTIMHGIERIWLYLVKYNYFKYKIIFYMF